MQLRSLHNLVGEYSNSTVLVNGYQSTLHTDKMYQASLILRPLQAFSRLQYRKDFSFARRESLRTKLYQVKVLYADNCKCRQAPAYTESSE